MGICNETVNTIEFHGAEAAPSKVKLMPRNDEPTAAPLLDGSRTRTCVMQDNDYSIFLSTSKRYDSESSASISTIESPRNAHQDEKDYADEYRIDNAPKILEDEDMRMNMKGRQDCGENIYTKGVVLEEEYDQEIKGRDDAAALDDVDAENIENELFAMIEFVQQQLLSLEEPGGCSRNEMVETSQLECLVDDLKKENRTLVDANSLLSSRIGQQEQEIQDLNEQLLLNTLAASSVVSTTLGSFSTKEPHSLWACMFPWISHRGEEEEDFQECGELV